MNIIGIIPARFASTRFPGKPLVDIGGKSMIQRVYEQVAKTSGISKVVVATDDNRIFDHVVNFGGNVVMTSEMHQSGTDRCYEAAQKMNAQKQDVIINIQGDEPFINPNEISNLATCFEDKSTQIATLIKIIKNQTDILDSNKVKVVVDSLKQAIYFSRSPIPFIRGSEPVNWLDKFTFYQHIGIYAYRFEILEKITKLVPSSLEKAESLEQLRWIENGFKIKTEMSDYESIAVDTPDDLLNIINKKLF